MVKIAAVVDSACLIGLERIGRLDLLPALLEPVFAPPAVTHEFGALPVWMTVEQPVDAGMVAALRLLIDQVSRKLLCWPMRKESASFKVWNQAAGCCK